MAKPFTSEGEALLKNALMQVYNQIPALARILKEGWPEEETLAAALKVLEEDKEAQALFVKLSTSILMPPKEPPPQAAIPTLFQSPVGLPQLNPLAEAAIIERLQFDGDIPELRTGPLPKGSHAAARVSTTARNPVALGMMLEEASKQVTQAIEAHEKQRLEVLTQIATQKETSLVTQGIQSLVATVPNIDALVFGGSHTDLETYKRGEVPAPLTMATPKGSTLAAVPKEKAKNLAWKALSTTQGRDSAVSILNILIRDRLRIKGLTVESRSWSSAKGESWDWIVTLPKKKTLQPAFSFIDTAAGVLTFKLLKTHKEAKATFFIETRALNNIPARQVGWEARLIRE